MEQLTKAQIYARAYYARNAEKIKAQKIVVYRKERSGVKKSPIAQESPAKLYAKNPAIAVARNKLISAREKIENRMIERELCGEFY